MHTAVPPAAARPLKPRRLRTSRTVVALVFREMSTTYGRTAMGYLWAILEPVAGIFLLTFVFSLALRSPSLGSNFPLFYASGFLPFIAFNDISQKISVAIRFSKPLLFYPGVTFVDALAARLLLNGLTQLMVFTLVLGGIVLLYRLDITLDAAAVALGLAMTGALAAGIGTLNCFLLSSFPTWERTWAILTRPLMIASCVLFTFDAVPNPYRDWLWWNPLVHLTGQMRKGIYATYDASYVSPLFVFLTALITGAFGLLLLRRYHRDIVNN